MYIEDIITRLNDETGWAFVPAYEKKFGRSISRRISKGDPLTSRQGYASLKLLRNVEGLHSYLSVSESALVEYLTNPKWRQPLIPSVDIVPEVRHLGDNILGFRTSQGKPFETRVEGLDPYFAHGMKMIPATSYSRLEKIIAVIGEMGISYDAATEKYLADALEHHNAEPRVAVMDDKVIFDVPNHDPLAQFIHHVLGADYL